MPFIYVDLRAKSIAFAISVLHRDDVTPGSLEPLDGSGSMHAVDGSRHHNSLSVMLLRLGVGPLTDRRDLARKPRVALLLHELSSVICAWFATNIRA